MRILILGAGRMGHGAAFDLIHNSPDVERVTIADFDKRKSVSVADLVGGSKISPIQVDVSNHEEVSNLMKEHDAVISCVNYWHNADLSRIALNTGKHLCDLGGNNYVVDEQLSLNSEAETVGINIIPDCGLAPGMVSILAMHGYRRFESVDDIRIRVGGLPQHPVQPLNYQLIFSVEGLINEYVESARVIRDGEICEVPSMTEVEILEFPNLPKLEAFQTSGGTSTLPETFKGKVRNLDYKTIRYAGHCEKFKAMIDIGLCGSEKSLDVGGTSITPRNFFAKLLEENLPADGPDLVLIRVSITGMLKGKRQTVTYDIVDRMDEASGISAMMRTTSFPASIIAQMMASGTTLCRGAIPQELAVDSTMFVKELGRRGLQLKEVLSES